MAHYSVPGGLTADALLLFELYVRLNFSAKVACPSPASEHGYVSVASEHKILAMADESRFHFVVSLINCLRPPAVSE